MSINISSSAEDSNPEDGNDVIRIHELEENNEEQTNQNEEAEEAPAGAETKPKRVVRFPRPKLNAETLKGPKGLQTLPQLFENVKFKGKGYEEQDLNLLMKNYEYWCHRLFPKFPFDDCLAQLEKLGYKKAVQTHIKKIRMDLLVDEPAQVLSDKEEDDVEDQFDEAAPALDEQPIQLTEEQLERIRLNKEKALKRLQDAKSQISANETEIASQSGGEVSVNQQTNVEMKKENDGENEEMDIESMLDEIAKGP